MYRYIRSSEESQLPNAISDMQAASNNVVDAILRLIDNVPAVVKYLQESIRFGDDVSEEFASDADWITQQLNQLADDIDKFSYNYSH